MQTTVCKQQVRTITVPYIDKLPGSQIFPACTKAFKYHLSPNKVPPSTTKSLNMPATIIAMTCFRAICRGLEYKSHSGNFGPVHLEWSGLRAWSLHFVSLRTCGLGSRFDLTDIMTTTATSLRTLFQLENSYYRIISIDTALLPPLSNSSRSHAALAATLTFAI